MRADPDVSIVIPARNEERYVTAALTSVAAQTWPAERLDIVVVDNGSTDATCARVEDFMATHPALAIRVIHEPTMGVARAKNRGALAARGHWLIFLDADSRMAPNLVACVVRRAQAGYAAGSIRIVADSHDYLDRAFFGLIQWGKQAFGMSAQMFYCARELFLRLDGFNVDYHLAEDREFLLRVERDGQTVCQLTESWIATSPRRLHRLPGRLGLVTVLARWALAAWGVGRRWRY